MTRQRLGQHFLADEHWREQIARAIGVSPHTSLVKAAPDPQNSCWIEVGAGHGEMTQHLLATGLPVYAIELDEPLAQRLKALAKKSPNLTVVHADVLHTDLRQLAAGRRIHLYGNLPYYITSPILQHLFALADAIDEIHIVIQEEVALRLAAAPDSRDYGYLSVLTQLYTRPEYIFQIPREAFSPPPDVASALVTLRLPGERARLGLAAKDEATFLDFVKLCFSKKRKTLVNNLRSVAQPEILRQALADQHLRPDARAEQLSISQFAALRSAFARGVLAKK